MSDCDTKLCKDCGEVKSRPFFSRDKAKKDGMATYCKECSLERYRKYYSKKSEIVKKTAKDWYENNKERSRENSRRWVSENRDRYLELRRGSHKRKYVGGTDYRINHIIRANLSRLSRVIGYGYISSSKNGYDSEKLRQRIECQFKDGMSWENYGEWEIDHKIPVSLMISRGEVRPCKINMLSNLQPMWAIDNRKKGNRRVG